MGGEVRTKPGIMNLGMPEDEAAKKGPEFALLKYFAAFQDQVNLDEVDLNFVKSLVDVGVDMNVRDEHGQTVSLLKN